MFNGWLKYDFVNIGMSNWFHLPDFVYTLIFHDKKTNTWEHCLCVDGMVYVLVVFTKKYFGCLTLLLCYSPKTGLIDPGTRQTAKKTQHFLSLHSP